jgi:L-Ala-D/L-Glu epimerase / N-acetyl-D-glutamate racemase
MTLRLAHTFTLSRSSDDTRECVLVEIEHDGLTGRGEAAPLRRYGESAASVSEFLGKLDFRKHKDPFQLEEILLDVAGVAEGNHSAKAAVDIALHDWVGRKLGIPLWKLWGLTREKSPCTTMTIGIDTNRVVEQKVREADPFPMLKVKVGTKGDKRLVSFLREITDKPISVDANEGWKTKEEARDTILWLEEQGVEFVEQPLPAHDLEGTGWLREQIHVPLFADENAVGLTDLPRLRGIFDGVNIKLMKCGGLREAMKMIHTARAMGMKILLGCMIESSVAISAAAHLSPLADYADLDGNLLITNDPFSGVKVRRGKLLLNDEPGLGVKRKRSAGVRT